MPTTAPTRYVGIYVSVPQRWRWTLALFSGCCAAMAGPIGLDRGRVLVDRIRERRLLLPRI
jgi:hypothetical protein